MSATQVRASILGVVSATLLLANAEGAEEPQRETRTAMSSLPAAVRRTAVEQSKGATVVAITREADEGQTVYEVAMKRNGRSRDIIIGLDGTVLIAEDEVRMAELPAGVRATLEKHAGAGRILRIETVRQRGRLAYYEAQLRSGKRISELKIGLDGKVLPAE